MKRQSKFALFAVTTFLTLGSLHAAVGRHHHCFHKGENSCGNATFHKGGWRHHSNEWHKGKENGCNQEGDSKSAPENTSPQNTPTSGN